MESYVSGLKRSMPCENLIDMGSKGDGTTTSSLSGTSNVHKRFLDGKYNTNITCKRQRLSLFDSDTESDNEDVHTNLATAALEAALLQDEDTTEDDFFSSFPSFHYPMELLAPTQTKNDLGARNHHHHHHLHHIACTNPSPRRPHGVNEMDHLMTRLATAVTTA